MKNSFHHSKKESLKLPPPFSQPWLIHWKRGYDSFLSITTQANVHFPVQWEYWLFLTMWFLIHDCILSMCTIAQLAGHSCAVWSVRFQWQGHNLLSLYFTVPWSELQNIRFSANILLGVIINSFTYKYCMISMKMLSTSQISENYFICTYFLKWVFLYNSSIKHTDLILKKILLSYFILKLQINNLSSFISDMNPKLKLQSHINLELYGDKMLVLSTRNEILNLKMCLTNGL